MPNATYPITGIKTTNKNGSIPTRKEIDTWWNDIANVLECSLFIRALTVFQAMDITETTSYFQVAGIHGEPSTSWDGAPQPYPDPSTQQGGYCAHNLVTFPTWHRPYMLLYEQRLWEIMNGLINGTIQAQPPFNVPNDPTIKAAWTTAANSWRLPYWDWGVAQPYLQNYGVPELLTQATVTILAGDTIAKDVMTNPLCQFTNPSKVAMGDDSMGEWRIPNDPPAPWSECIGTSRYEVWNEEPPNPSVWAAGGQDNDSVNLALQRALWYNPDQAKDPTPIGSLGEFVYRLFTEGYCSTWEQFASTVWYQDQDYNPKVNFLSLEYIHNNIHNWTGGSDFSDAPQPGTLNAGGHMSDISVAAFDPIFWLHHCNIDRLLAIFQTLYPKLWFDTPLPNDPKPTDPLQPFHTDTTGDTWTSDLAQTWTNLYYQYDDLSPPSEPPNSTLDLVKLRERLNAKYSVTRKHLLGAPKDLAGRKNDYVINVIYDRYGLPGPAYTIHFFIGAPTAGPGGYSLDSTHIGSVYTFNNTNLGTQHGCGNCKNQKAKGILSRGQVPVTSILLSHVMEDGKPLGSLEAAEVEEYLKKHLQWRVVQNPRNEIPLDRLPAIKVFVMQGTAEHYEDKTQLSKYHDYSPIWNATDGKQGGAGPGDHIRLLGSGSR